MGHHNLAEGSFLKSGLLFGVGIDLVENERMREILDRWNDKFKSRVFLSSEQEYCDSKAVPYRHYAARFAVKEAVSKAFGTGLGPHIGLLDIEVVRNNETGAPSVDLHGAGAETARLRGIDSIVVSLSHTRDHAVAQALIVMEQGDAN